MKKTAEQVTTLSSPLNMATINSSRQYCNMLQIMNNFCLTYKQDLSHRNTLLSTRIDPDIPQFFYGDPLQIMHLLHVLSQFSLLQDTTGGGVDLDFKARQTSENLYFFFLTVTLSGVSIPRLKVKELFSPPETNRNKSDSEATANSLYFARKISQLHGGGISIQNNFSFGTQFLVKLCLPCKEH